MTTEKAKTIPAFTNISDEYLKLKDATTKKGEVIYKSNSDNFFLA